MAGVGFGAIGRAGAVDDGTQDLSEGFQSNKLNHGHVTKNKTLAVQALGTLAAILALGLSPSGAFAAALASDNAANYSSTGWSATNSPNLGYGFGPWDIGAINDMPPYSGTYLDETPYGNPDGVLSAGYAWGTYANGVSASGQTGSFIMDRPFTAGGGSTSLVNQTFSIALGSAGIGGLDTSIGLSIGTAFGLDYGGGGTDDFFMYVDSGDEIPVAVDLAQLEAGIDVALTVTGPLNSTTEDFSFAISPFAGGPAIYTLSGTFDSSNYNTSYFSFGDNNTSGDQFVNNPTITSVPEPTSIAMLGFAGVTTWLAKRRRK